MRLNFPILSQCLKNGISAKNCKNAFANSQSKLMSSTSDSINFDNADIYEKFMGVWSKLLGSQFIEWLAPAKGQTWVDIGCGNGAFTTQIIENCAPSKLCGIDPSNAQIEFAKNRPLALPVNFQTGDAMSLPYNSDSFDIGDFQTDLLELYQNIYYLLTYSWIICWYKNP